MLYIPKVYINRLNLLLWGSKKHYINILHKQYTLYEVVLDIMFKMAPHTMLWESIWSKQIRLQLLNRNVRSTLYETSYIWSSVSYIMHTSRTNVSLCPRCCRYNWSLLPPNGCHHIVMFFYVGVPIWQWPLCGSTNTIWQQAVIK